ncbi:MAG TPA: ABC transporter ATP-binding protein [Acidimicrobiales bacterium]|nr:ABC transporter ATP-binding protein [Acidimicrobiales bacterium]
MRLALEGVSVSYGPARALESISLTVADGAWVGLIGPNGAGKSTVLKVVAGLINHEGSVTFDGGPRPPSRRAAARIVAYVPQRPELPFDMTVFDYVLLGRTPHLGPLGREGAQDRQIALASVERLGLGPLAGRGLGTISGGEAQRAVLARALSQGAPLLLLDEPTTGLDLGHQQQVLEIVDELRQERAMTVLSSMHDLVLAGQFTDSLALLDRGEVAALGAPSDVLTADHLTRFFDARVGTFRDTDGHEVLLPVRATTTTRAPNGPEPARAEG